MVKAKQKSKWIYQTALFILVLVVVNFLAKNYYWRWDATDEKKYTLAPSTIKMIASIDKKTIITVFLSGDFPANFKRLEYETQQMLEEFQSINENVSFHFLDPYDTENAQQRKSRMAQLQKMGLTPTNLSIKRNGEQRNKLIYPWAIASMNGKKTRIPLLKTQLGTSPQTQINNSIENLEYTLAKSLQQLSAQKKPTLDILLGHGELPHLKIFDLGQSLSSNFDIQRSFFQIDEKTSTVDTLKYFQKYFQNTDILIIAKPSIPFNYSEKYILDQYIMGGGKVVWMVEPVIAEMDSLLKYKETVAIYRDLNLKDQLFRYGVRINPQIIKDLNCASIRVAAGKFGGKSNYKTVPWQYYPLAVPDTTHPIVNNLDLIKLQFANTIDTLQTAGIEKSILLESSPYSKRQATPSLIRLQTLTQKEMANYREGRKIIGVLLEGSFTSAFKNRTPPLRNMHIKTKSKPTQMVVISDGDVMSNETHRGRPLPLGYDKWIRQQYGNKDFMINVVNYLVDSKRELMHTRVKSLKVRALDKIKLKEEYKFWQYLNLVAPTSVVCLIGLLLYGLRKWRYHKN